MWPPYTHIYEIIFINENYYQLLCTNHTGWAYESQWEILSYSPLGNKDNINNPTTHMFKLTDILVIKESLVYDTAESLVYDTANIGGE